VRPVRTDRHVDVRARSQRMAMLADTVELVIGSTPTSTPTAPPWSSPRPARCSNS
jgi:hypothetical protein